jgi:transposase
MTSFTLKGPFGVRTSFTLTENILYDTLDVKNAERRVSMEEEIRKQAIHRHIVEGESPKSIYTSLKRSKPWFFKWLKRYQAGDADWFKDHGRAPRRRPAETSQRQKGLIITTRQRLEAEPYAQIGVTAIKWALKKLKAPFPSDRTITRIVKREGLVKKNFVRLQRGGLPLLYGGPGDQQHPPGRPGGAPVY